MIVDPLKHVQKNFEVDPSFGAKVMRLFVFAYCETSPGLRKISIRNFFFVFFFNFFCLYSVFFYTDSKKLNIIEIKN